MPPPETGMVDAVRGPRWMSVMLPVVILGAVLVLIVPVPPAVLDLLLSANITLGVVILLTTLAVSTPRQFDTGDKSRMHGCMHMDGVIAWDSRA